TVIQLADPRDPARRRRPHREMDSLYAAMGDETGPEPVEESEMRPLGEVVVVHLAEHRAEAVGVDDRPGRCGVGAVEADELAPGRGKHAFEEPGGMAALERAEGRAIEGRRFHPIGAGHEGARTIAAIGRLDAEAREGVGMRPGDEFSDFLAVKLPRLAAIGGAHAPSYAVGTPQMSRAYSRMVRSAENQATLAELRIVLPYQVA